MREAAVCRKLQEWIASNDSSNSGSSSQQPVVFGLITSQPEHNTATVSLQYKFYKVKDATSSTDSNSAAAWNGSSGGFGSSSGYNTSSNSRQGPEHPLLQPLDLAVHNLGAGQAAAAAAASSAGHSSSTNSSSSNMWGSASLPALGAVLQSNSSQAVLSQQQVQQLQEAAAAQAGAALQAVQGLYDSLLDELQVATAQVRQCIECTGGWINCSSAFGFVS
jgi:hypothetical protein